MARTATDFDRRFAGAGGLARSQPVLVLIRPCSTTSVASNPIIGEQRPETRTRDFLEVWPRRFGAFLHASTIGRDPSAADVFKSAEPNFSNRASSALTDLPLDAHRDAIPPAPANCSMRDAMFTPSP